MLCCLSWDKPPKIGGDDTGHSNGNESFGGRAFLAGKENNNGERRKKTRR